MSALTHSKSRGGGVALRERGFHIMNRGTFVGFICALLALVAAPDSFAQQEGGDGGGTAMSMCSVTLKAAMSDDGALVGTETGQSSCAGLDSDCNGEKITVPAKEQGSDARSFDPADCNSETGSCVRVSRVNGYDENFFGEGCHLEAERGLPPTSEPSIQFECVPCPPETSASRPIGERLDLSESLAPSPDE
jgi:hypothetical protein